MNYYGFEVKMGNNLELKDIKMSNELRFVIALSVLNMTKTQHEIAMNIYALELDWELIKKIVTKNRIQPQFIKNI